MAVNLPGPYEIEYVMAGWNSPVRNHAHRVSVAVLANPPAGTLATAIDVQKMGGATAKLNVVANQYWEFIRLLYPSAITCSSYILWKYVAGTLAKDFISSGNLTNTAGSGAAVIIAAQATLTFRSANGGVLKLVYLESSISGSARVPLVPNPAGTPAARIAAYVMSADNIALARDDGYPVASLNLAAGENERIFRKVYRS